MSTSRRTAPYHHEGLREKLLQAALGLVADSGAPSLSLRETARRAGVSAMAPYRHFADREALLAGVAAIGFDRLAEALRDADRSGEGQAALVAQGVAYVAFAHRSPALFRLMFGATAPDANHAVLASSKAAYGILEARLSTLVEPSKAQTWTLACWSIVHGLAMLAIDGKVDHLPDPPSVLAARVLGLLRMP